MFALNQLVKRIFLVALSIASLQSFPLSFAREISHSGEIFNNVRDGIVTVVRSVSSGSGFLVDEAGLVVTNSHVVREAGNDIRIRFGHGQIVRGKVLLNDHEKDIAIIYVNLENIQNAKVLPLFPTSDTQDVAVIGEKVLAIGSPVDWVTLEKTLTEGIVGKVQNDIISHDARINPGNSGGPLLNFDGQIIGINTFLVSQASRSKEITGEEGIANAISIAKLVPLLKTVKATLSLVEKPSSELLPDIPKYSFPVSKLINVNPSTLQSQVKPYEIDSNYFKVLIQTPPIGYKLALAKEEKMLKNRKKRAAKKGFEVKSEEYDLYENMKDYNYNKPVVTVVIVPKPKATTGSKVFNTISVLASTGLTVASFAAGSPRVYTPFIMGNQEIKKDFFELQLKANDNLSVCAPFASGRTSSKINQSVVSDHYFGSLVDSLYFGVYEFDAKCFQNPKALRFTISTEGDENALTINVPETIKREIVQDFVPYWQYVNQMEEQKSTAIKIQSSL